MLKSINLPVSGYYIITHSIFIILSYKNKLLAGLNKDPVFSCLSIQLRIIIYYYLSIQLHTFFTFIHLAAHYCCLSIHLFNIKPVYIFSFLILFWLSIQLHNIVLSTYPSAHYYPIFLISSGLHVSIQLQTVIMSIYPNAHYCSVYCSSCTLLSCQSF